MIFELLKHKEYIGDGVYVGHDGFSIWIFTYNGVEVKNEIAFEPNMIDGLYRWYTRLKEVNHKKI